MLVIALILLVLAGIVLRLKTPADIPNSSRLYRIDNRVVAAVLALLALVFGVLAWTSERALF